MVVRRMMGARVKRKEDPRLITGTSLYVDDLHLSGALHAAFYRSPFAHAHIKSIDTAAAEAAPGVVQVFTSKGLDAISGPMLEGVDSDYPTGSDEIPSPKVQLLAQDKVRWVGEPIAVVVAETEAQAADGAELIDIEFEELPVVNDVEQAIQDDAPKVWEPVRNNIAARYTKQTGDTDSAFNSADVTISERIVSQRMIPMAMEGRATVAAPDPHTRGLTIWTSTQAPHWFRNEIAERLKMSQSEIRVITPEVGGGFGSKISSYQDDTMIAAIARTIGRPVQWAETRSENMLATHHGRAQVAYIELAATNDGKITGMRLRVLGDSGGYPRDVSNPFLTLTMAVGCYDIPSVDIESMAIYTNRMAVGAYRGAGRPEAAYYIERGVDMLAHKLGMDPAELRKKNFIKPEQFPYTTATGERYDTGDYANTLDHALKVSNYQQLRQEQAKAREEGRLYGIGISSYVEICGFGPYDSSVVKVEPSGAVSVYTGISPHGQGQETTFAQMVADQLGANFEDIVVHHGDTDNTAMGNGTMGSRGLVVGGSALMLSLNKLRDKADRIAAHLLEVSTDDIELEEGRYQVKGSPDQHVTLGQIAKVAYSGRRPEGMEAGLNTTDYFSPEDETFPFGSHIAVVEIDPESGEVKLTKYYSIDDCGNVISPLLVAGQVHGGLAQGIAQALTEEAVYDENGQLITATMMDYAIPKAELFPHFELDRTVTTTPLNPLGAKGIGEAATIGSTPAVANAVVDALFPLGISHLDVPLTPPKVWQAIHEAQS